MSMNPSNLRRESQASSNRHLVLMVILVLAAGCATTNAGYLDTSSGLEPSGVDEEVLEAGSLAEATLTLARVWSVASGVQEVGAQLSFTFWSERGALTLMGYSANRGSGVSGQPVDDNAFQEDLAKVLTRYAQQHTGALQLTLVRNGASWRVNYTTLEEPHPPEAKTLPVRRAGLPAHVVQPVIVAVKKALGGVEIPSGAHAHVQIDFYLEDDRVEASNLQLFEVTRAGSGTGSQKPAPSAMNETITVLLPFTQGVGERTVRLDLRLASDPSVSQSYGWVTEAQVSHAPPHAGLNTEFVAEYRMLHESILRRWREETREGAEWVARKGAQELALWYAGGIAARGLGWLGGRIAPTVLRALQRGKVAATGWLRTTLSRLPAQERAAFERLWAKVQLEGRHALGNAEREELRAVMESIEQLIHTPLDTNTKNKLRGEARAAYKRLHPHFAEVLERQRGLLPIHHRRPLEYAHCFPADDINSADNLIMLTSGVHDRINALWNRFRRARPHATARDVETVAKTIDDQFGYWYHQASELSNLPHSLNEAEGKALEQLRRFFPGLE